MATDRLFTAAELGNLLGTAGPVDAGRHAVIEQVVWGWLVPVLGVSVRPDPVPAELFSWAVELGAIAHENPAGYSARQLGPEQKSFSSERRDEILAAVAAPGTVTSPSLRPRGKFPSSCPYPDPARR